MSEYIAPIKDIQFTLNELAGLAEISRFPSYSETTPDIVSAILDEASSLAGNVLAPLNKTGDEKGSSLIDGQVRTPDGFVEAYRLFREAGWQSLPCDPERGGQGLPRLLAAAVNEMWQSANLSFALCPVVTEGTIILLETFASRELNDLYTTKLISGAWTSAMVLTEPQAGSDLAAIKTRALPNGDHYLITGQKIFITWGDHDLSENILHLVLARLPDAPPGIKGISLFLVPKFLVNADGSPGRRNDMHPVSLEHKLGIHASPTCVMSYGDNEGAVGYLIGEVNNGIACMFTLMNHARLAVGMQGLSISERAYQKALNYARERVQGTIPGREGRVAIIHHPDVRRMLMTIKSGTEAMRALCYVAAAFMDYIHHAGGEEKRRELDRRFALLTPVVKGWCTELANELTSLALQVHGGMGYVEETGAAQFFRDARIATIYEGTTGIQARDLVNRKILRDKGEALSRLLMEMRETISLLEDHNDENTKIICRNLGNGVNHLENATAWLIGNHQKESHIAGAVSYNFLMLMGTVCGGWQMGRAALTGFRALDSDTGDKSFYETKIISARFYAEHLLTRSHSYLQAILAGSESMMKLEIEQF